MAADVSVEDLVAKLAAVRTAIGDAQVVRRKAVEDLTTQIGNFAGFKDDLSAWLATFDEDVVPHVEAAVSWVDDRAQTYAFGSAVEAMRARAAKLAAPQGSPLRSLSDTVAQAVRAFELDLRGYEELSQAISNVETWFHDLTTELITQQENAAAMTLRDAESAGVLLTQIRAWLSKRCGEAWPVRRPVALHKVGRGVPAAVLVRSPKGHELPPDMAVAKAAGTVTTSLQAAFEAADDLAASPAFAEGGDGGSEA